ncbi:recombinase family protein [Desulfobacterium sp. N47]
MIKSAIYVRSSKDLHNVSCEAQEKKLRKTVRDNGEEVYNIFVDKALSSTRDVRPQFDEMIRLAMGKNPPFTKIYALDTSRFGRDHHEMQMILYQLRRKHGIDVIFDNMPNTGTYLDPAFEAIFQAFDYIHSQQSKAKGVTGMKQNVINGYRAGGRAPYGYKLEHIEMGKNKNGDMINKTKLAIDDETAPIIQEYLKRRVKYEDRRSILEDFYTRGIASPTGNRMWAIATAKSIEDNIDVYLGHTVFNRHNERIKEQGKPNGYLHGVKFKSKDEWIITKNTHEPIITEEIADAICDMKNKRVRESNGRAKRVYPLSGVIKCSECGTNYVGDGGVYRCNSRSKPGMKCDNNDISSKAVEDVIFSFASEQILKFKNVKAVIEQVKKRFQNGKSDLRPLEEALTRIEKEQQRLTDLYRKGLVEVEDIEKDMISIKEQKKSIIEKIQEEKASQGVFDVSDDEIKIVIDNLGQEINNADAKVQKKAFQALFEEIRIHQKEGEPWSRKLELKTVHLPITRVNVASPRGFEPLSPA